MGTGPLLARRTKRRSSRWAPMHLWTLHLLPLPLPRSLPRRLPLRLQASTVPPSSTVGGAAHASTNQYAALESDDDDSVFVRDVGVSYASVASVATKPNPNASLYLPSLPSPSSVCFGYSSHVAAFVGSKCASPSIVVTCGTITPPLLPTVPLQESM